MSSNIKLILVVEDYLETLENNCKWLSRLSPEYRFLTAETPAQAIERLQMETPDLIVADLLFGTVDGRQAELGVGLLRTVLEQYSTLNILVYSSEYKLLAQLMPLVSRHKGGFAALSKLERREKFLEYAKSALNREFRIPIELRDQADLNEEDIEVLMLVCKECLTDKAVADRLHIGKRAAQNRIQRLKEKLSVSQDESLTNSRIELVKKATERGFLK